MLKYKLETPSPECTQQAGYELAGYLRPGDCIPLTGNLGTGKTCFVQGVAKGLEVPDSIHVTSPSFTLVNRYPGIIPIFHADFYRLSSPEDLNDLEFEEILNEDGVTFIEWPQIALTRIVRFAMQIQFHWDMKSLYQRLLLFQTDQKRFAGYFRRLKDAYSGN